MHHIEGLLEALRTLDALPLAEVHILTVGDTLAVTIPEGDWTLPSGETIHGAAILTLDNLPPQGLLLSPSISNDGATEIV